MSCVYSQALFFIASILQAIQGNIFRVVPEYALVEVGDSVVFRCLKKPNDVYKIFTWNHRPVGKDRIRIEIHNNYLDDTLKSYEPYFSFRDNLTTGEYDMIISNISLDHAGTYYCIDSDKNQTTAKSELVVIKGLGLTCESNISLQNPPLGDNICGWEPDNIEFNCTIQFEGNKPPIFIWTKYNDSSRNLDVPFRISESYDVVTSSLVLKNSSKWNGTSLVCEVGKDSGDSHKRHSCQSPTVIVQYAYEANETIYDISKEKEVVCAPNTSFSNCEYQWTTIDNNVLSRKKEKEIIMDKKIQNSELTHGRTYQCTAECTFRNRLCEIKGFKIFKPVEEIRNIQLLLLLLLLPLPLVMLFIYLFKRNRMLCFKKPAVKNQLPDPEHPNENLELMHPNPLCESIIMPVIAMGEKIEIQKENGVKGVIWFENRIYAICGQSKRIHTFSDQKPYDELENDVIECEEMKHPYDMCKASQSIFISDSEAQCLWKIQLPGSKKSQWKKWNIDGIPRGLSVTSADELLLMVEHVESCSFYLAIFRPIDVSLKSKVPLPREIIKTSNAVQLSNQNFVISYRNENSTPYLIGVLSADGEKFNKIFDPSSLGLAQLKFWYPHHLAIFENDCIFVADSSNGCSRILLFNSLLSNHEIILNKEVTEQLEYPSRILYVQEKCQLIVGQGECSASILVFDLHKNK